MTLAEHVLWRELRQRKMGASFRRQYPVSGYVLDFYAPACLLGIEVDGPVHDASQGRDAQRDARLAQQRILILRFANDDVINALPSVIDAIRLTIATRQARAECHAPLQRPDSSGSPGACHRARSDRHPPRHGLPRLRGRI